MNCAHRSALACLGILSVLVVAGGGTLDDLPPRNHGGVLIDTWVGMDVQQEQRDDRASISSPPPTLPPFQTPVQRALVQADEPKAAIASARAVDEVFMLFANPVTRR